MRNMLYFCAGFARKKVNGILTYSFMTHFLRIKVDRLFQSLIRLGMLTGVTFLVTACYGPAPDIPRDGEGEVQDTEHVLKVLSEDDK